MSVTTLYQTSARATGGRDGHAATPDNSLHVTLTTPKELGGSGGAGTNPEQLFAAGYAACFLNAMKYTAGQARTPFPADASVTVGIGPSSEGNGFGLTVALAVALPGMDAAAAQELMETAHGVCPYSNAIRNNVDVKLSLV